MLLTLLFAGTLASGGCHDHGIEDSLGAPGGLRLPSTGRYSYRSYDSTGVPVVSGWFTLVFSDSIHCTGEWHFLPIGSPTSIGPQTGDGSLVGSMHADELWVELQPQFRDNNLELVGKYDNGQFSGKWIWISFIGVTSQGTFTAKQQ
jgi:hypothetical protein